jgi:hypothetical protein
LEKRRWLNAFQREKLLTFKQRTIFLEEAKWLIALQWEKLLIFWSTLNHIFGKGKWLNAEEAFVTTTSPLC